MYSRTTGYSHRWLAGQGARSNLHSRHPTEADLLLRLLGGSGLASSVQTASAMRVGGRGNAGLYSHKPAAHAVGSGLKVARAALCGMQAPDMLLLPFVSRQDILKHAHKQRPPWDMQKAAFPISCQLPLQLTTPAGKQQALLQSLPQAVHAASTAEAPQAALHASFPA